MLVEMVTVMVMMTSLVYLPTYLPALPPLKSLSLHTHTGQCVRLRSTPRPSTLNIPLPPPPPPTSLMLRSRKDSSVSSQHLLPSPTLSSPPRVGPPSSNTSRPRHCYPIRHNCNLTSQERYPTRSIPPPKKKKPNPQRRAMDR